ncbi:histidine phosphatase family protein [Candidatus Pacearchaeota archaeon]|nr:histidine phosphatase family protein [Candidatus Pacearchaeota archaeon]
MEIVFVRHAEKKEGDGDLELSEKGIQQAKNLAKRLSNERFDEIYCSGLKRAIETARFISEELKLSPKIENPLNEFESNLLKIKEQEWDEKSKSQYDKLKSFLENFTNRAEEDKRILIIAHGITNRLILAILLELELKNLIRFRLLETAVCEVYWMPKFGNWRLKYWNDVSHQPKELVEGKNKY